MTSPRSATPRTRIFWATPGDGHVVHAAITGRADIVVTDDARAGFENCPDLADAGIEIATAARFAAETVAADPKIGLRAVASMSARMASPPKGAAEVLGEMATRYGMKEVRRTLLPLLER